MIYKEQLKTLSHALLFNLTWLAIVSTHNKYSIIITGFYLVIHFSYYSKQLKLETLLIFSITVIGYLIDSTLQTLSIIKFNGAHTVFGILLIPGWVACLWLCFATTLLHSLRWFSKHLVVAGFVAVLSVPSTYYAGAHLSSSIIPDNLNFFLTYGIVWGGLFPLAAYMASRLTDDKSPT